MSFRPLGAWLEGDTPDRRSRWTFKASWPSTLDLLDRELHYLDATNVALQADFRESDLRSDGMPRSNARAPQHPGVRLAFDSVHGPLTYATDSCAFWQHNVRSIALGLEALRAVDRYGVTRRGEQYRGWRALGQATPTSQDAESMQPAQATRLVYEAAGIVPEHASLVPVQDAWRTARANTHPDRNGGERGPWDGVERAGKVLGLT